MMTKTEKNNIEKNLSENEKEPDKLEEAAEETIEEQFKISQEKLLRTMAEMENQRRRFEKEKKEAFEFGGFNFAAESLSLLDNIERAMKSFKEDEILKKNKDLNKIIDGIEVVLKDSISIFKKNGIEPIECINKKFNPNFHQAMLEIEDDTKAAGTVIQEIQKGYMMKGRLLRPSFVGVTKKRDKKIAEEGENEKKTSENEQNK